MNKIKILAVVAFAALSFGLNAQSKTNLYYSMGVPMSSTADFIEKTSFRGMMIEWEKFVTADITIGFITGWNTFYEEKPRATYSLENGAITSNQYRYVNSMPLHLTGKYYFTSEDAKVRPFIGTGIGTNYIEQKNNNGLYSITDQGWTFVMAPKAGVNIPFGYSSNVAISLDYNYSFKSSRVPEQTWLGINVGFSWDY